jgi:hypothetical protein
MDIIKNNGDSRKTHECGGEKRGEERGCAHWWRLEWEIRLQTCSTIQAQPLWMKNLVIANTFCSVSIGKYIRKLLLKIWNNICEETTLKSIMVPFLSCRNHSKETNSRDTVHLSISPQQKVDMANLPVKCLLKISNLSHFYRTTWVNSTHPHNSNVKKYTSQQKPISVSGQPFYKFVGQDEIFKTTKVSKRSSKTKIKVHSFLITKAWV